MSIEHPKSVARSRCLSKLWGSLLTLGSPYFTELFLTHSKSRPCLLCAVQQYNKWLLYSCPQPQISYKNSQSFLSLTAEVQMSFPEALDLLNSSPVSGLIYCPYVRNNNGLIHPVLCNPSTGQILWLPRLKDCENLGRSFVGYDPIDKQFTVLSICYIFGKKMLSYYQILKLGSGKRLFWRNLECPLQQHFPSRLNTYVNGVLYYVANLGSSFLSKIVCFDYKLEEFKFIVQPWHYEPDVLVNFKGKLCGIYIKLLPFGEIYRLELNLWILEDFERQKWTTHSYCMPSYKDTHARVVGVSVTGDIVWSSFYRRNNSFYVYFFNPEKNSLQKVEIKGVGEFELAGCFACVNHVEDLIIF